MVPWLARGRTQRGERGDGGRAAGERGRGGNGGGGAGRGAEVGVGVEEEAGEGGERRDVCAGGEGEVVEVAHGG